MLDFGSKGAEKQPRVIDIVRYVFLLVEHATIAFVQFGRQVPMEERTHWYDTIRVELVDQFDIVVQTGLVDWIIPTTQWDYP